MSDSDIRFRVSKFPKKEAEDGRRVQIGNTATRPTPERSSLIENVREITPKRCPDGRDEALELISENGYRNLLFFDREARMAAAAD